MSASDLDLGMAALRAGRWEEGIARLQAVLAIRPGFAEVWSNLGFALREAGRRPEAREALERALHLKPELADTWNLLGLVDQEADRHREARDEFDRALQLRPDFVIAVMNRANSEQALGNLDAALAGYGRAIAMAPEHAGVRYNLAHLHQKVTGDYEAAREGYREAIRLDPHFADAHLNLAHMLLALGQLAEGWREFAWRPQRRNHEAALVQAGQRYELPAAITSDLRVRGEQGLGDILFFLRFANARVAFNGDRRLHPLLERTGLFSPLSDDPATSQGQPPELLIGDLPLVVDPAGRAVPPPLKLVASAREREQAGRRLREAGPPPWIALTWRAGERGSGMFDRLFKQVPLQALGAALRGTRATWISLQRAPGAGERQTLANAIGAPVHDFSGVNADLELALATLDLVDDYVSVSNTNVHLRAGLGRAARVLVAFAPEWRWGLEGRSPWFPEMETYREARGGDWSGALAALSRDMRRE